MNNKHYQIDDLKKRLIHDKKSSDDISSNIIPPYIRKYNRRFKSIYESMHKGSPHETNMLMNYEKNFRSKKNNGRDKHVYGHFEKYQHDQIHTNEIPENDILSEIIHKSGHHKKHRQHHHHHHHSNKIKKLRTKPEAGIMQKKIKI
ncbi:hypothetical protein ACKWTF_011129 [Chironomus riparius]